MAGMQYGFGSGVLYGIRNDIANATPVRFGVLQDVQIEFNAEVKTLFGQLQYSVDIARGKAKITGKAKIGLLSPLLFNNLYFGQTNVTGQKLFAYSEAQTTSVTVTATANGTTAAGNAILHFASVPANVTVGASIVDVTTGASITTGTYVISKTGTSVTMSANAAGAGVGATDVINFGSIVTSANSANFDADLGPMYASTGLPLIFVAAAPLVGQYTISNGIYVFSTADAVVAMLLNYTYLASGSGFTMANTNLLMGTTPKFQAVFNQTYSGNTTTLKLFSCVASKLTFPTKMDDYVIPEIDFEAFSNSAGNVFELSMSGT